MHTLSALVREALRANPYCGDVFVFRSKRTDLKPSFRVPGYPWVPLLFVALAAALVVNTFVGAPRDSLIGLALILSGVPAYFLFFRESAPSERVVT